MAISSPCSTGAFVTKQLGAMMPSPWHAGIEDVFPASGLGSISLSVPARPTADQPWPFTPGQYARLLLVRSCFQQQSEARCRRAAPSEGLLRPIRDGSLAWTPDV
jgi:hypothetical protein